MTGRHRHDAPTRQKRMHGFLSGKADGAIRSAFDIRTWNTSPASTLDSSCIDQDIVSSISSHGLFDNSLPLRRIGYVVPVEAPADLGGKAATGLFGNAGNDHNLFCQAHISTPQLPPSIG